MEKIIKKILKEDFDWVDNVPSIFEIGEPLPTQSPKNTYRLYVYFNHGNTMINDDYSNYPTDRIDSLINDIKILNTLYSGRDTEDGIRTLVDDYMSGQSYIRSLVDEYLDPDFRDDEDAVMQAMEDVLRDYNFIEWDSYGESSYATVERMYVTYFDEHGVEHGVKVNLPNSKFRRF